MAKAFLSYKHDVEPDEALADCFTKYLIKQGHQVFIDKQILIGQKWPTIIKQKIEEANCLVVLISADSVWGIRPAGEVYNVSGPRILSAAIVCQRRPLNEHLISSVKVILAAHTADKRNFSAP